MNTELTTNENGTRNYLTNEIGQKKCIPKPYHNVYQHYDEYDFNQVTLTNLERFHLEVELFKEKLYFKDMFAWELIQFEKAVKVFIVEVKFDKNRLEVQFSNGICVRCKNKIYLSAPEDFKAHKYSNY